MNVVITGANRGIGLELVRQYREQSARVIGICRESSRELVETGAEIVSGVDVTDPSALSQFSDKIDLLINNAGIFVEDSLSRSDFGAIEKQFHVNALGPLRVTHALLPHFARGSKIAMITSRMGSIADNSSGGYYGYRMSKAALNMAAVSLARDLAGEGIAVGVFHPGYVRTDMTGGTGDITAEESARGLISVIQKLSIANTGTFWHSNGQPLEW